MKLRAFYRTFLGVEFWSQTELDYAAFEVDGARSTSDEGVDGREKRGTRGEHLE